jgi:hypothetical protein
MRASRAVVLWAAAAAMVAPPALAQRLTIGVAGAGGDYREASNDLRYEVSGLGGTAALTVGGFAAEGTALALTYRPAGGSAAAEEFKATQFDGYLRYRVYRSVSLEAGVAYRKVDDEFKAQSAAAVRIGAHSAVALGPGAGAAVRVNYLAGAKFSGGGRAPLALDVGLSFFYGFGSGRVRVTGESQFQRYNRTVDAGSADRDVPLQQLLGRLGLAVSF